LESRSSFKHFTSNFIENIFEGLRIYESYSRLSIAIILAYTLLNSYYTCVYITYFCSAF
jgi:hypothetical protein